MRVLIEDLEGDGAVILVWKIYSNTDELGQVFKDEQIGKLTVQMV